MYVSPNDHFADEARAGLLEDLTGKIDATLAVTSQGAVDDSQLDGKLYVIPEGSKTIAMYYDATKVPNPPKSLDDLLAWVKGGGKLGLTTGSYWGTALYNQFGGQIFDADHKCAAGANSGVADAMKFAIELKKAGALVTSDYGKTNDAFLSGTTDMTFNGNWVLGDYKSARPDLQVAPVPGGPAGPAAPFLTTDGYHINASSPNKDLAIALAQQLVDQANQTIFVDVAGHVPANSNIKILNTLVSCFAESVEAARPRWKGPEMNNYYAPFDNAWNEVIEKGIDPAVAIATACATLDKANNK